MIGSCDICDAQKVEVTRCWVSGIETFVCEECENSDDSYYRAAEFQRSSEYHHDNPPKKIRGYD